MFLYTIVPIEAMFDESEAPKTVEVVRGHMRLLVTPVSHARGRIVQVISSNPHDFLVPSLQPGTEIALLEGDAVVGPPWDEAESHDPEAYFTGGLL